MRAPRRLRKPSGCSRGRALAPPPPGAAAAVAAQPVLPTCSAGILACLDGYMNIAMEQTEEYVNGQLKNKYGDCFIRGNNGEAGAGVCAAGSWFLCAR